MPFSAVSAVALGRQHALESPVCQPLPYPVTEPNTSFLASVGSFWRIGIRDQHYRIEPRGYPLRRQAARSLGQLKNPQAVPALKSGVETVLQLCAYKKQ